jgi:hypothetical protein
MVMVQNTYGTKWFLDMVRNCNFVVRNGYGAKYIWYEIAILWYEMVNYGTKWLWCKIHMVRNGFWSRYEIAILWYEIVNNGTKWQWYEMVMVRNDLLRSKTRKWENTEISPKFKKLIPETPSDNKQEIVEKHLSTLK